MARKQKSNILEDSVVLTSMMPWWVGLILALISFLIFNSIANIEVPPLSNPAAFGSNIGLIYLKGICGVVQYVAPIVFLIGSMVSLLNQIRD